MFASWFACYLAWLVIIVALISVLLASCLNNANASLSFGLFVSDICDNIMSRL
jgi:hypothetical protein